MSGDGSRRGHRSPVNRDAVRRSALRLFADRGYRATTMADIASALGIQAPSLYKHVASKQELLSEIMLETMTTLLEGQQHARAAGGNPLLQLQRMVEAHVRYHATHREHAFVGNREIESLAGLARTQVLDLRARYEQGLRAVIEAGQDAGVFDRVDSQVVSFMILDMGMGLSAWYRPNGRFDVDALAYTYADMAVRMVGAAGSVVDRRGGRS